MKNLYSILLMVIAMFGISQAANAQTRSATFVWDTPGTVAIKLGSTSADFETIPDDATSYTVNFAESFKTVYLYATGNNKMVKAVCQEDKQTFTPYSNGFISVMVNANHYGHTFHVYSGEYAPDSELTINLVSNNPTDIVAIFGGATYYTIKPGEQKVSFNSVIDNTIQIQANAYAAAEPYIKKNGEDIAWTNLYGTLKTDVLDIANGDVIEVKYNNDAPVPIVYHTISLEYADDMAKSAVNMIFNKTKLRTIDNFKIVDGKECFEVEKGDIFSIAFNTYDYDITVNGTPLTPSYETATNWLSGKVTDDMNIKIEAKVRVYGDTKLSVAVQDPEGVILRRGDIDGEIINLADYTYENVTQYNTKFKLYSIPVNLKSPKIFISAAPGWFVTKAGYNDPDSRTFEESNCAFYEDAIHYTWTHKISNDTKLVVYYKGSDGSAILKDLRYNVYPLSSGYNEFMIDPEYCESFSVQPMDYYETSNFSVYKNYTSVSIDENGVYSGINISGESVIHIFAMVPASKQHTFSIEADDNASHVITYDRVLKPTNNQFKAFVGSEVSVKPAFGYVPLLDDKAIEDSENGVYTFIVPSGAVRTHTISFAQAISADDLKKFTISPESGSDVKGEPGIDITIAFAEGLTLDAQTIDNSKISVKFNDNALGADGYQAQASANTAIFSIAADAVSKKVGKLALNLAEGWVKISNLDAPAIDGEWNVVEATEGIDGIFGDDAESFTVVTIDGRTILVNADAEALNQLAPGLYIINGQKIYIAK